MKIAFVCQPLDDVIPPFQNSLAIWTCEVAHRISQACEVILYAKSRLRRKSKQEQGVSYQFIPVCLDQLWLELLERLPIFKNPRSPLLASRVYYPGYALQIALSLRKQRCDVIHIHNFSQFVPIIRAFNPTSKIVLHMHGEWLTQLDQRLLEKRLCHVDLIVGCSDFITQQAREQFPQFANRCQTLVNGVDIQRFIAASTPQNPEQQSPDRQIQKLLFVGRVSPEKGVHTLLEAFQIVAASNPKVYLKVVGYIGALPYNFGIALSNDPKVLDLGVFYPDRWNAYLAHWQQVSRFADRVEFTGNIRHSELPDHYREADLLVFPSIWPEPFGMPLVEAMAAGLPVIATRGGAFPEIVEEGKTGLLVERGDAKALATAILNLLADTDLRRSMGAAGRQRAIARFSWQPIVETLLSHYKQLCNPSTVSTGQSHDYVAGTFTV
ncbi:MAG: glycosyltransferase family 4 protein [Leptolyngbyaceae bacterium]|nr:glycosyltransferase family 4 protein [Leptolyngbyaceae bacterium]